MNGGNPPALVFRHVSRSFGDRTVLKDVSFEVAPGEAFCLLGRSGQGKSVTLKLTIGIIQPDSGTICVENDNIVGMDEDGLMFSETTPPTRVATRTVAGLLVRLRRSGK